MASRARSPRVYIVACLLGLGFWQLGQGAYIPAKAWVAQELMQRAWHRAKDGDERATPWPWADTWPVAKLSARAGAVELIVLSGGSGRTLAFGPGHLSGSSMPGEIGNFVIAGHRDTHFNFLRYLKLGETIVIESTTGQSHLYRIIGMDVVDSRKGSLLLDTEIPMLSLVTCYPFNTDETGGPLRFVVTAKMLL